MSSFKRKVFINISDTASYIGQNKWSTIDPFQRLWAKADTHYTDCLNTLKNNIVSKKNEILVIENKKVILENQLNSKMITKRQYTTEVKKVEKKIKETKQEVEKITEKVENVTLTQTQKVEKEFSTVFENPTLAREITETIASTSTDTKDKRKTINESIDKLYSEGKIKEDRRVELLKNTESLINKTHGTLKEQSAIDIFEEKYHVTLDISQKYYKYLVKSTSDIDWYIGGRLDGVCEQKYIVEVKNRTKGFFNSVRDYELTQIQLYLLLTGYTEAKLLEKFNDKIRITDIPIDSIYITEILSYLCMFIDSMESFMKDDSLKIKYLNFENDTDKQKLLNKLYLEKITKKRFEDEERKIIKNEDQNYMSDLDSDEL